MAYNSTAKRARDVNDDAQKDSRPAKRMIDIADFDNTVTVLVGSGEKRFILHQDAVCAKSKFFKAACSKRWREGQDKVVCLPEVKPDLFKAYCDWIYSGEIAEPSCSEDSTTQDKSHERNQLLNLYLLGDVLDDIHLRNLTINMLFQSMRNQKRLLSATRVTTVWESTLPGSQLRKMILSVHISKISHGYFARNIKVYPSEFLQEIAVALMKLAPSSTWEMLAEQLREFRESEQEN